jgi:hypothetical protein
MLPPLNPPGAGSRALLLGLASLLLVLACLLPQANASRVLQQQQGQGCVASSTAVAGGSSQSASARAVSDAFADCRKLPPNESCDAIAKSRAEVSCMIALTEQRGAEQRRVAALQQTACRLRHAYA